MEEGYAEPPLPVNAGWERRDRLAEPSIPGLWQWALDHTDAEPGGGPQPSNLVPALLSRGGVFGLSHVALCLPPVEFSVRPSRLSLPGQDPLVF